MLVAEPSELRALSALLEIESRLLKNESRFFYFTHARLLGDDGVLDLSVLRQLPACLHRLLPL